MNPCCREAFLKLLQNQRPLLSSLLFNDNFTGGDVDEQGKIRRGITNQTRGTGE